MIPALAGLGVGLVLLTIAADRSVLAASRLSLHYGISPVLVGALVIGTGTSIPELVVSLIAGEPSEAMGNVVGSNISNLTLVLGSAALFGTIFVARSLLARQGLLMGGAMACLLVVLVDGDVERVEGLALLSIGVLAYIVLVRLSRSDYSSVDEDDLDEYRGGDVRIELLAAPLSLAATVAGAWIFVAGAERLADELSLTGAFVGLVILAVGTSLPELATALAAARRGEPDLIVGNVIGSNLFNSLLVGGSVGLIHPGATAGLVGATVLMAVVAVVAGMFLVGRGRLDRVEGSVLLLGFVALIIVSL